MDKLFTISANITKCLSSELVACHRLEMVATFATGWQHLLQVGNVLYFVADESQLRPSTASLYQLMCGKIQATLSSLKGSRKYSFSCFKKNLSKDFI